MPNYIRSHNNNCMEVKDLKIKENKEILFGEPVNNTAQSWALTSLGDGSGFCTIDIAGTGYCLEIKNSKVKNGTAVILGTKTNSNAQHWKVTYRKASDFDGKSMFSIHSRMDENYVLDVAAGNGRGGG